MKKYIAFILSCMLLVFQCSFVFAEEPEQYEMVEMENDDIFGLNSRSEVSPALLYCAKTGMSYSKGWSLIRSAEKELGYTVVERSPGGKHGGVASVSEAGKDILRKYELLEKDVAKYAEKRYKDIFES